jgi:dihydroorotase
VADGKMSLERFIELTSAGPQRVFGIAGKGRIAQGYDADFTVVDLKARRTITHGWSASRCGWTPFDGMEAKAWPVATFVRGSMVMCDDQLVAPGRGEPVRFSETLPHV